MKVVISAESTIDMPIELLKKYNINTVPFGVLLGETLKMDGEFPTQEIIEYVSKNKVLPKTSAVNEVQYEEHFNNLLKTYDAVVHIALSSEISSAYQNACNTAKKMKNVYIIDSRSLSTGIGLLAIYASSLASDNLDAESIVERTKMRVSHVQTSFILERLDYLYKGGRCSGLALFAASMLRLRPQILVIDGKMAPAKKYMGKYDISVIKYVNDTLAKFNNPDLDQVFITYTTSEESVVSQIKEILKQRGFKNIMVTTAGATITSHCGEHCLGILYINDGTSKNRRVD